MAKKKSKKTPRSLYVIAQEIHGTWPNVYYGAVPYLSAMGQMATMQDMYGVEDAKSIVLYFLANATSWRGPDAKRIKAELNAMVKAARAQRRGNPTGEAPQWNPAEYETYDVTITPEAGAPDLGIGAERAKEAAVQVLKSLHLWSRAQYVKLHGVLRVEGLNFERFRDLIAALEFRDFNGRVDVDGQVTIIYEEEAKERRRRTRLQKKRAAGRKQAKTPAQRRAVQTAYRRALRGT